MALTVTPREELRLFDRPAKLVEITFDSSYPTGGEAITGTELLLPAGDIDVIVPFPHASRICVWDRANSKLLLYTALATEAANASNQSTITVTALVVGGGAT